MRAGKRPFSDAPCVDEALKVSRLGSVVRGRRAAIRIASLLILGAAFAAPSSLAGTWVALGPVTYTRGTGSPVTVTNTFTVLNPNTQYTLKAFNGGLRDSTTELVSSCVVTVNGVEVVGQNNFNQNVTEVDLAVTLQASNTISVTLYGQPGGQLDIEIIGVDNDPPTIKATVSPLPNAAGWNNTNVTVSFTCSDATSGVASCPAAQTITTEGANQVISGTATDQAGNTASTSVTLNIDKTPPAITASVSPAPNAAGWNTSNVTVTFTCSDTLSGVTTCPAPVTVSTEGAGQVISGTATDVAGNTATVSATVSLDKTAPTLSITSPTNGATFSSPSVQVTGSISDALSGVSTVTCNSGTATIQNGAFSCSLMLAAGTNTIAVVAADVAGNSATTSVTVSAAGFTFTGNLNTARDPHTATLLTNGSVLVVGGQNSSGVLSSAELYASATGTFTVTGSLNTARSFHTATLLTNGMVLIVGGQNSTGALASAELYNPATGTFGATGSLNAARYAHIATLLPNGTVLIAGGENSSGALASGELYNPATGNFTVTANLNTPRYAHTATLLNSGTVLIAGGQNSTGALASSELYNSTTGNFTLTGNLNTARYAHTATLVSNGTVLIAGGENSSGASASAELYDPAAGAFSITGSLNTARYTHSATLLNSGTVLITGGLDNGGNALASAELYEPVTFALPGLVSIAVNPPNPTVSVGTDQLFTATGTFSDNSTQTLQSVIWNSSNSAVATVSNASGASGYGYGVSAGTTTVSAAASTVSGSTTLTVQSGPPNITSLSSSFGAPGLSVTISGSGFGSSQGSSTVTFNGTSASIVSWSGTQVTATVPPGAASGNVVVTVAGVTSNVASFNVVAPPTISASASPAANAGGWDNLIVTATFTCTPGGLAIASCPSPQTISTDGANQVVSGTVTDVAGDAATASVTVNVDRTPPSLSISSPADGSTVSSSTLTVTGSLSDNLSGASGVTCDSAAASLVSGTFSCNVSLSVGNNLVIVRGTDVAGNVAAANFRVTLSGTLSTPSSLMVTPASVNMVAGDTHQFTAVDDQGRPRSDATWTVSNTTIATIDTNSSPTLTAVAVGQVTLTATIGSTSASATINVLSGTSLPLGTITWSAPNTSGQPEKFVQAQTIAGGPSVYVLDGNLIRALSADGQQLWTAAVPSNTPNTATLQADGNGGGLLGFAGPYTYPAPTYHIIDLDAQTGAPSWQYDCLGCYLSVIGNDGKIHANIVSGFSNNTELGVPVISSDNLLVTLDGKTGAVINSYAPPRNVLNVAGQFNFTWLLGQTVYSLIAGPDGNNYGFVQSSNLDVQSNANNTYSLSDFQITLSLLKMKPDGTVTVTPIHTNSAIIPGPNQQICLLKDQSYSLSYACNYQQYYRYGLELSVQGSIPLIYVGPTIPDGQGGLLLSWIGVDDGSTTAQFHVIHVTSGGRNDFILPLSPSGIQMVLGDGNVAYAADGNGKVAAFDISSGQTLWTYQSQIGIVTATSGRGLVVNDSQAGLISFDSNGTATTLGISAQSPSPTPLLQHWFGIMSNVFADFAFPFDPIAVSPWPQPQGDLYANNKPPSCWILNCALIPDPDPRDPGTDQTTVYYWLSSLKNGRLTELNRGPYDIELQEIPISGSYIVCGPAKYCTNPVGDQLHGEIKDSTVGIFGSGTVQQFFYVNAVPLEVFWPSQVDGNTYYGSETQLLTVSPSGRTFQQQNPDLQNPACNTKIPGC